MSEMKVYIANLGKYNEGELVGAWFTPPINIEDVKEKIGLNNEYEEYAIHDYELPFTIGEFTSIEEINHICELVEELEGSPIYDSLDEIKSTWFSSIEDLVEHRDDIQYYSGCDSMEDVAYYVIDESGLMGEISTQLQSYFDYQAYGRDLEISGNFLVTKAGVFEYVG